MNNGFSEQEVKYIIDRWYLWKGMAIGGFITLITLTLIGLFLH